MTLSVDVTAQFGAFQLAVKFETRGGLTALFGPSGSGKTSLMEFIGGIRKPDRGWIDLDGMALTDTGNRRFLAPHRRRIGWVFQEARLFPHLTGRQNLTYGRFFTPRSERNAEFDRIVDLLDIGHLLDRRPMHFSGGEKARVAIGRALLSSPRLLLMDEPLAALDEARKAEILPYIERLRDEGRVEIVYVTHSLAEVVRLANDVVLMAKGHIVAFGATTEVLARFDLYEAIAPSEAGAVIEVKVAGDADFGLTRLEARAGTLYVSQVAQAKGADLRLRIKARDVLIAREKPSGISALNVLAGRIKAIDRAGLGQVNLALDCGGDRLLAAVTTKSAHDLRLEVGMPVYAIVKSVSFDRMGVAGG